MVFANLPKQALLAFLALYTLLPVVIGQFVAIPGLGWLADKDSIPLTKFTPTVALPTQQVGTRWTLQPYEAVLPARASLPAADFWKLSLMGKGGVNIRNFGPQLYEVFKFWIEADFDDITIELKCSYGGPAWLTRPIKDFTGGTITPGVWTAGSIPLNLAVLDGHIIDKISFYTSASSTNPVRMRIMGYAGNADGTDTATFAEPLQPPSNLPAYTFATQGQGGGFWNDQGLECVWACDVKPIRGPTDMGDVFVQAYRDTSAGPLPMNIGSHTVKADGVVEYPFLWSATDDRRAKAIAEYPNPFLGCLCQTADFFIIGDRQQAKQNLTVWMPITTEPAINILLAYTRVVKSTRDANGRDTMSVLVRMRIPNELGGARSMPDYEWVQKIEPNCNPGSRRWLCPDHIIFSNTQLGALHLGLGRLQAITDDNYHYFKRTGYDVAFDLHPAVDKLLYYSGEYYGIPAWIQLEHWHINTTAVDWLHSQGKRAPPPIDDWGVNWRETWNMKEFTDMAILLNQAGRENVIPFASNHDTTAFFQYLVFRWGATMLDTQGRCGLLLDDSAERALNETFVKWIEASPTLSQYRGPWTWDTDFIAAFEKWKSAPPKDDPLTEPVWNMADVSAWEIGNRLDGFATLRGYGGKASFRKIFPPQGVAKMTGALIGLATSSKNATFAHDAMMIGFAQNSDYKANMAVYTDPSYDTTAWTSGYRSAFSTPDYKFMTTVMQIIDQELLAVGAFPGYPVQQSQAFGLVEPYDPMNLVFNEIQFKRDRVTVKEALQHACTIIDFLTLPPCTKEYLEVYVSDVPGSNKGDLMYRWPANSVNKTCRLGVAKALTQLPEPIRMALPLKYTSIYSVQAQVMVALSAIGIVFELLLAFLFLLKSRTQVIKAASVKASLTIFMGACLTLSSVIMRVTSTDGNGWFQCWGTYYAFAVGFGLVLGSLAIKSYRISYIFNNSKKSMNTSLSDRKLMGLIASVALIEIVLCLILEFALADPSTVRYVELPGLSSTVEQYDCPTSHMGGVVALYIFNVLLIIGAAYFAFKTRNVIAAFNENVFTSAAILLISVVTIVIVPVLTLITSSVAIFMLIALGTIIATVLSTAIFGVPKILIAFEVLHMAGVSGTLRASTAMTGGGASSVPTNERSARGKGHSAEPSAGDVRAVKTAALSPVGVRTSKVGSVIVDAYRDSVQKGSDEDA